MNLLNTQLNRFVDLLSDFNLCKSLGKVPTEVDIHWKSGKVTRAIRNKAPNTQTQPKSLRTKFQEAVLNKNTSLGTKITSIDKKHFFRRVNERHASVRDVMDALNNPIDTHKGSNDNGSTVYVGKQMTVVVIDDGNPKGVGQLKTVYPTKKGRR